MLCFLVALFLFMRAQCSISSYEPFSPVNPLSLIENNIPPLESFSNRKSLQSNRVIECDMEDIFNIVGLNEIQELIEVLASRKGTTPFSVLRMLQKRMRNKEEIEQSIFNSLDRVPIPDVMNPPLADLPPPVMMPPVPNEAAYSLPSNDPTNHVQKEETDVVIVPVIPSQNSLPNRLPSVMKTDFMSRNQDSDIFRNMGSAIGNVRQSLPGMFPLPPVKNNQLRPPFGATVRVDSSDSLSPISRDIIVTVSPFMTVIEALRQAEIAYRKILGLNHETDVITFTHSSVMDCYIVDGISDVTSNEEIAWKVTLADRDSQVIYSNFCLPNGRETFVKPGTLISLSYVPL